MWKRFKTVACLFGLLNYYFRLCTLRNRFLITLIWDHFSLWDYHHTKTKPRSEGRKWWINDFWDYRKWRWITISWIFDTSREGKFASKIESSTYFTSYVRIFRLLCLGRSMILAEWLFVISQHFGQQQQQQQPRRRRSTVISMRKEK